MTSIVQFEIGTQNPKLFTGQNDSFLVLSWLDVPEILDFGADGEGRKGGGV